MPKLSQITPKEILKLLISKGFVVIRQKGSHIRLSDLKGHKVTLAIHSKPIAKGTLLSILKQASLNKKDLVNF